MRPSAHVAQAIVSVVQALQLDRGQSPLPSHDVQLKAAEKIPHVKTHSRPARVYEVPSYGETNVVGHTGQRDRVHIVALFTRGTQRVAGRTIIAGRCSCDHWGELHALPSHNARICHHLLSALTLAHLDGYRLETRP